MLQLHGAPHFAIAERFVALSAAIPDDTPVIITEYIPTQHIMHMRLHAHAHARTHALTRTRACAHARTHTHTRMHAGMQACGMRTCMHACIGT